VAGWSRPLYPRTSDRPRRLMVAIAAHRLSRAFYGEDGLVIETILEWFRPATSGPLAYVVIGGIIFLDRAAFTGLFIPGELVVALGGVLAGRGHLSLLPVIAIAAIAGILGESVSYWLGRRYGVRIVRHVPIANRVDKHVDEASDFLRRHGGKTVFIARYVSVVGTFMPFVAGMSKMPFGRFLTFDVAAITLWATAVTLLGYFLNSQIHFVDQILSQFGWGLLALLVIAALGRIVMKRRGDVQKWVSEKNPFG
jgi:membrane-associated protein